MTGDFPVTPTEEDVALGIGPMHLRRHGRRGAPPLLCIPGLSANAASFDHLAEHLAGEDREVVAVDLRGRGRSPAGPRGTLGWPAHARDVLEVATHLRGDTPVDVAGHSMGCYVAMALMGLAPQRIRRLVLVDGLGRPEAAALPPILRAVERLGSVVPTRDEYVARVRAIGAIDPWDEYWDRYFDYELVDVEGGVRSRTDPVAVAEDVQWGRDHDQRDLWAAVRPPVLLVRSTRPLGGPGGGFIVRAADRDAFLERVPGARCVEVDAGHYTVVTSAETATAVRAFLLAH